MRRVVTGHDAEGRSIVVSDGTPPRTHQCKGSQGFVSSLGSATEASVSVSPTGEDPTDKSRPFCPAPAAPA